jgi:hypothetical protein
MDNNWLDIRKDKPEDGQRVLTWNNYYNEPRIQVYNEEYQCWDLEDGDDFEYPIDDYRYIIYWQPLPGKPNQDKDTEK